MGADALMHEGELGDRGRAEHERIRIMQPHAAVDRIDGEGQRQPRFDKAIQIAFMGIEVELGNDASGRLRLNDEAKGIRGLEYIDHVEIMRPGLREILPRVRTRIGRNAPLV